MATGDNNKFLNLEQLKNYTSTIKNWVVDYTDDTLKVDLVGYISAQTDKTLDINSNNAVSNATVTNALNNKASTAIATTSSNGLMSSTDKTKLNGIATGANKTTVDTYLSSTSTNPVRNSTIYSALNNKQSKIAAGSNNLATGLYLTYVNPTTSAAGQLTLGVSTNSTTSAYKSFLNLTSAQATLTQV